MSLSSFKQTARMNFHPKNILSRGFTIIETMVAISLGLIVLGGVLSTFLPTLQTWRSTAALSSLQDVEQIAHDRLGRVIRQSSLMACGANSVINGVSAGIAIDPSADWAFSNINKPFRAYSFNASNLNAMFGAGFAGQRLLDTDAGSTPVGDLFFALASDSLFARIKNSVNHTVIPKTLTLNISTDDQMQQDELLLVHDCRDPVVLLANSVSNSPPNQTITYATSTGPYSQQFTLATQTITYATNAYTSEDDFDVDTIVSRFIPTLYYLGTLTDGRPALFARTIRLSGTTLTSTDQAVLTGVVNMRIEYGIDTNINTPAGEEQSVTKYYTVEQYDALPANANRGGPLTVRLTLMVESDQITPNHTQAAISFPKSADGSNASCPSAASADASACPIFIDYQNRQHKVISFIFNLSRQTAI